MSSHEERAPGRRLASVTDLGDVRPAVAERVTYTVPEVAALLGLSRATAYVLLAAGEIPARRVGGRWIIARRRFDTWLNETPADARTGTENGQ